MELEKVLKHLDPRFLVLFLQMPRKRSCNALFFCEPSCKQVSFAIYVHMYTSALNSFLHHKTCSKWTAFAAHRKQTNKLLRLLWLSHRRKAQGNRNVQRTENISRYLKTNGKFSRKGYPKQTSFGYRIFYKFYNLWKGIHTKLDFRWAQIALNFLEENYAICSHPPSQIFVVWMKLPCRGKYSSETSGLQE